MRPPLALARLAELAHDPGCFVEQGRVHLVQRHPGGRAHGQAIGPDGKADGAALAAAEFVADVGAGERDGPVGAGMGKALRRQGPIDRRLRQTVIHYLFNSYR